MSGSPGPGMPGYSSPQCGTKRSVRADDAAGGIQGSDCGRPVSVPHAACAYASGGTPALIETGRLSPRMWVMRAGERVQIISVTGGRVNARRADSRRTSFAAAAVQLAADQGVCADCLLPLVPGEDEEAHTVRAIGLDGRARYFCGSGDDALHHPSAAPPAPLTTQERPTWPSWQKEARPE